MGSPRGTGVGPWCLRQDARERAVCWRSTSPHVGTAVDQFPQFGPSGRCQRVCRSRVTDAQVGKRVPPVRARRLDGRAGAIVSSGVLGRFRPLGVGMSLVLGARCSHHGDILAATERRPATRAAAEGVRLNQLAVTDLAYGLAEGSGAEPQRSDGQ